MAFDIPEQIRIMIEEKKHVLLVFGANGGGDEIASTLGLYLFLTSQGKRAEMVSPDFRLPTQYQFLNKSERIGASLSELKTFIMTVDVKETGVQELSYDLVGDKLRIFVTPKKGILSKDQVKTAESSFKYDLIITIGTPDLTAFGDLYTQHPELFEQTPIINIDADPANEHYGHINLVDITATSVAEILFDLMKKIGKEYISEDVATALLTGMIAKTHSFKSEQVKPHTLTIAGKLINLGANRDYIVEHLYRTRTIAALRLWGEALSHLHVDHDLGMVSTLITRDDFVRSGAQMHDLEDIVDELISNSPEAKVILLMYEDPSQEQIIHATLYTKKGYHSADLLKGFNAQGNQDRASLKMRDKSLKEVETILTTHLREQLYKRFS